MIFIFVFILTSWDDENLGSFGVTKMRVRSFYVSVAAVSLKTIFVDFFLRLCVMRPVRHFFFALNPKSL